MTDSKDFMTTQAFAEKAGVSTSTVSKWIRDGKIEGKKVGKRWMIQSDQLPASKKSKPQASVTQEKTQPRSAPASGKTDRTGGKNFTVSEFSDMTYLTEFGVEKWLREGRLKGSRNDSGIWSVDAGNLDHPNIQRLLRSK